MINEYHISDDSGVRDGPFEKKIVGSVQMVEILGIELVIRGLIRYVAVNVTFI